MSTFDPPPPYTPEQRAALYPSQLELRQVQVVFRHGERTPVSARLQNAGIAPFWPYCHAATRLVAPALGPGGEWDALAFRRRLETFGKNGEALLATGPKGQTEGVCLMGELTDRGRETTLALGERLRKLYVDDLKFLPEKLSHPGEYYLRATSIVRARESLQQVFTGLYPAQYRMLAHPPVIHSRVPQDENLFPNESNCRRFNQLARSFANLAAEKWNSSPEMAFLQEKIGKWMPEGEKVAVDSHPRLAGLQDSINSTLSHGPATKLPDEFYDPEVTRVMNDITVDEWFRGYKESTEYRRLGVGSLLGDLKSRAVAAVNGQSDIRIALMGCHDTTIAGILATLGAFDHVWPPFTSSIAVETFRLRDHRRSFWDKMMGKNAEQSWYVRLRYNEKPIVINGCRKPGKHLEGDESFCTMTAFREMVENLAPSNWKKECLANLDKPGIPPFEELY